MDKQPVGQLPDLTQSNNDDEIMIITDSEHNQLKKEKISNFITDLTSTNENNALTKGTDGKMFVTDFGNASNITEGTLPTSVLPEIPLEKIPDIPKDKLPPIETADLPVSGVTADTYAYPSSVTVNSQGQVTAIEEGTPSGANADTNLSNLTSNGNDYINQSKALETGNVSNNAIVYANVLSYAHSNFDESKFIVVGSANLSSDGILTADNTTATNANYVNANFTVGELSGQSFRIETPSGTCPNILDGGNYGYGARCSFLINSSNCSIKITTGSSSDALEAHTFSSNVSAKQLALEFNNFTGTYLAFYKAKDSNTWIKIEDWTPTGDNKELYSITESPTLKFQIGRLYGASVANYKVDLKTLVIKTDTIFTANITGSDTVYINGNNDTGVPTGNNTLPYVLSKTGSKIADASYRNLIEALYQEQGYAPYYTIDEENQTFTLPKGEIYGMIQQKLDASETPHVVETYINTEHSDTYGADITSWYRIWSDGWCEQGQEAGSASNFTQDTTINLLKPYKDINYFLSGTGFVIGSIGNHFLAAKTNSSFTTSSDIRSAGTNYWMAAGYINLDSEV